MRTEQLSELHDRIGLSSVGSRFIATSCGSHFEGVRFEDEHEEEEEEEDEIDSGRFSREPTKITIGPQQNKEYSLPR